MARFPFAGTWNGQMRLRLDTVPMSVDINVVDNKYASNSYGPDGGRTNHLSTGFDNGVLTWRIKNSGGGVWIYEAKRIVADTIFGTVMLSGTQGRDGKAESGTLVLVRRR
jgi:hypothetical protein